MLNITQFYGAPGDAVNYEHNRGPCTEICRCRQILPKRLAYQTTVCNIPPATNAGLTDEAAVVLRNHSTLY
jgi:hypothetical protein